MNVYDFDGTIYNGDSTVDFYFFSLKKNKKVLKAIPVQLKGAFLYSIKRIKKDKLKEYFFSFLQQLDNTESLVENFWDCNIIKIKKWYLEQKLPDDVIISASPEFLIKPIGLRLGINKVIASVVDFNTGRYMGINCKGKEKVNRFLAEFPKAKIHYFYSDSISDAPLATLADKSYIVKGDIIHEWRK